MMVKSAPPPGITAVPWRVPAPVAAELSTAIEAVAVAPVFRRPKSTLVGEITSEGEAEATVVTWEAEEVLKLPTAALFRQGEAWAVYVVDNGRARRTLVTLGHQTGQEAEVASGVSEGARVVLHPGDTLADGARVKERPPLR